MSKELFPFPDTNRLGRKFYNEIGDGLTPVAQELIVDTATGIAASYQLPEELYTQGIKIPSFRATDEALLEARKLEADFKGISLEPNEDIALGMTVFFPGSPVVLVNEAVDEQFPIKLRHELIHGMTPLETDKSVNKVNEAVVSVLEVARRNRYIPFYEPTLPTRRQDTLFGKVFRGEEALSYWDSSFSLLVLMSATHFGEYPFGPQELARHYFGDEEKYQDRLKADLFVRIPSPMQPSVNKHFGIFSYLAA